MLNDLLQITGTLDYEHGGWTTITSADRAGSDLVLGVRVRIPDSLDRAIRITCERPRVHHVVALDGSDYVALEADHVLLWPHVQKQAELYFSGTPSDPMSLLGALVEAHHDTVGDWFPFDWFLNLPGRPADILRGGYGLLARGPVTLLDTYARVLDKYGIKGSKIKECDPAWWDGDRWTPETEKLRVLIVGGSYVVAPSFREKVD